MQADGEVGGAAEGQVDLFADGDALGAGVGLAWTSRGPE